MTGDVSSLEDLLAALEEASAHLGLTAQARTAPVRSFLAGPPVVRVVGPPHAERAAVAECLTSDLPSAQVLEAAPAVPDPEPLWDVAVLVTPADRALSLIEERFIADAAAGHRAVLVLVSRMSVLGDERAQAEARRELERYRLGPLLKTRQIPWFYLDESPPVCDAALAKRINAVALREGGHQRAARVFLMRQTDELIQASAGLLDARRAELDRFSALQTQLGAQRASVYESVRTSVLAALDRLRSDEEGLYGSVDAVMNMTEAWLDSNGLIPWADVEYPLRRAQTALTAGLGTLVANCASTLRADLGRVARMLDEGLQELGLRPAGLPNIAVTWALPALEESMARLREADPSPVLSAVRQVMQQRLADAQRKNRDKAADPAKESGQTMRLTKTTWRSGGLPPGRIPSASASVTSPKGCHPLRRLTKRGKRRCVPPCCSSSTPILSRASARCWA